MFDNLKALGALSGLMKNKEKIAESAKRVRDELASARVSGEAGGGIVRAVVSGDMRLISVEISPALGAGIGASESDRAMASALIAEAVNDALTRARGVAQEAIRRETEALGLPADLGGMGAELFR